MNQIQYLRALVIFNGAIPLAMLAWDARTGRLGANSVNEALHITGLLSLVGLCLTLLMTPLQWVTRWGGWIAFRRALGLYSFFYAMLHLAIYIIWDRALNLGSTLQEIGMRQFLQVGALALFLMAPLALTSTNGMIRWMGPKRWKMLHRLTYPVAGLAVLHYYMLVKSDVRQPLAFATVVGALLAVRVGRKYIARPSRQTSQAEKAALKSTSGQARPSVADASPSKPQSPKSWKGKVRVAAIVQETHDVKTFRLESAEGGPLPFDYQPGQFVNIQLSIDGKTVNRSYTLASSPTRRNGVELTIKRHPMGLASKYMHDQVKVGDVLSLTGPAGKFTFTGMGEEGVLLIAGGVGITPVMSIARYLTDNTWNGAIHFLYVGKTEQDLIFWDELTELSARFPNLKLHVTLSRCAEGSSWAGSRGRLDASMLQGFAPHLARLPVYLCGPNEMMEATRKLLVELGAPQDRIHTEAFAGKKSGSLPGDPSMPLQNGAGAGPLLSAVTSMDPPMQGSGGVSPADVGLSQSTRTAELLSPRDSAHVLQFTKSRLQTTLGDDVTVLEAAEAIGLELPYECRSGFCGQCKVRLLQGRVRMDCEDALSQREKEQGVILACQSRAETPLSIDA